MVAIKSARSLGDFRWFQAKAAEAVDDYDCPVCGAFKGEPCTVGADRGDEMTTRGVTHVARVELA